MQAPWITYLATFLFASQINVLQNKLGAPKLKCATRSKGVRSVCIAWSQETAHRFAFEESAYDSLPRMHGGMIGSLAQRWAELFVDELAGFGSRPYGNFMSSRQAAYRVSEITRRYSQPCFEAAFLSGDLPTKSASEKDRMAAALGFEEAFVTSDSPEAKPKAIALFESVWRSHASSVWGRRDRFYAMIAESSVESGERKIRLLKEVASQAYKSDQTISLVAYEEIILYLQSINSDLARKYIDTLKEKYSKYQDYIYFQMIVMGSHG